MFGTQDGAIYEYGIKDVIGMKPINDSTFKFSLKSEPRNIESFSVDSNEEGWMAISKEGELKLIGTNLEQEAEHTKKLVYGTFFHFP